MIQFIRVSEIRSPSHVKSHHVNAEVYLRCNPTLTHTPLSAMQWVSYQILKIAGCAGNAGNVYPHHRGLAIPTCIMARASRTCRDACWDSYLAVFFEVGGRENVPGNPSACTTCNFTYLARGPSQKTTPAFFSTPLKVWLTPQCPANPWIQGSFQYQFKSSLKVWTDAQIKKLE